LQVRVLPGAPHNGSPQLRSHDTALQRAARLFADFLAGCGHSLTVEAITEDDVRAFIADQLERWKPLTALNRYRGLQAFFKWAVAEGELDASPMAGMNPPQIPDEPPPVLTDDELRRLLKACEGRDFADRRDAAILRLFLDIGVRVSEAAGIMLPDDLDLDDQVVVVLGQGRRPRRSPSVARLPWRLTATCGCGQAIRSPTCRTSGSAWPGP
jgi:site-specific recombinase XerC